MIWRFKETFESSQFSPNRLFWIFFSEAVKNAKQAVVGAFERVGRVRSETTSQSFGLCPLTTTHQGQRNTETKTEAWARQISPKHYSNGSLIRWTLCTGGYTSVCFCTADCAFKIPTWRMRCVWTQWRCGRLSYERRGFHPQEIRWQFLWPTLTFQNRLWSYI